MINYYEVLHVKSNATIYDIKTSYKELCEFYNPKFHKNEEKEYYFKLCEVNESYEILRNIELRRSYDKELRKDTIKRKLTIEEPITIEEYFKYSESDFDTKEQEEFCRWMDLYAEAYYEYLIKFLTKEELKRFNRSFDYFIDNILSYEKEEIKESNSLVKRLN
ncbi:MAG: DnaJ domain-containing protein [Bacilli bacterium]